MPKGEPSSHVTVLRDGMVRLGRAVLQEPDVLDRVAFGYADGEYLLEDLRELQRLRKAIRLLDDREHRSTVRKWGDGIPAYLEAVQEGWDPEALLAWDHPKGGLPPKDWSPGDELPEEPARLRG